jgi:glycosyltransferase involved in cell wall biosynthesis/phospholipid N-methyltransferase
VTSLSVLVPVYNERFLVASSLERLKILATSPDLERVEVVVVDDASRDDTPAVLRQFEADLRHDPKMTWTFLRHERNGGKGQAIRTALDHATCEITVIHDADLEYHPRDLLRIVRVFAQEQADAVFGSRFSGGEVRRVLHYRHQIGNRLLTFLVNLVTNLNLTDMETCYKAVRTDLLKSIPLLSRDFRIEPELTIKLAKRQARIFEMPISYSGRTYAEGKKINWRDGVAALWAILRFAASDRIYRDDEYGSQILARLSRAPRFNAWMADTIRPYCGSSVLEIGSGVGNLTQKLLPRERYVASDINPLYLRTLGNLETDRPYLRSSYCDVTDVATFPKDSGPYDTVICLNVIEHVGDDRSSLLNIGTVLAEGGRAIVLVPQGQWNYGTLDEVLGHRRRYDGVTLRRLAADCGFEVERIISFNRIGTVAWYLNGKIMRRRSFGLGQVLLLNALTPLFRLLDRFLPVPPLSLIAILRKPAAQVTATAVALTSAAAV